MSFVPDEPRLRGLSGSGGIPCFANAAPPCSTIHGTCARVSTLLITVGQPKAPSTAGKGGLMRGWPRLPSRDSSRPVSSPQMYAPAPACTTASHENSVPRMRSPRRFAFVASSMAASRRRIDAGYSPRT